MATEISISTIGGRTPMPNDISAPSTPLSLSFTQFRLSSTDSMQSLSTSSVSYYNSSPILRDFHDMSLALTDDEDLVNDNNNSLKKHSTNSLFVFCDNKYNTTPTPTPRPNHIFHCIDTNEHELENEDINEEEDNDDDEDNECMKHICSFKFDHNQQQNLKNTKPTQSQIFLDHNDQIDDNDNDNDNGNDEDENINLSDDENDANPFLMGLQINIPSRNTSGYVTMNEEDVLPEIESCDDDEEDEYSNNYFVDDIDCDEYGHFEQSLSIEEHDASDYDDHVHQRPSPISHDNDDDNDGIDDDHDHDISIDRKFIMKKYKYIENIGIGAFGIVDKVYDRKKSKYVAIKVCLNNK